MNSSEIIIIVPCYNEFDRFPLTQFEAFLKKHSTAHICFVNDSSTDNTQEKLESLQATFNNQIKILGNSKNLGKAESVRKGMLSCVNDSPVLAYLDADLATSLKECYSLLKNLQEKKEFVFASRILKIGSIVERKFSRFVAGRIIATFISSILDIKVYDTQCGCKLFKSTIVEAIFKQPFISKWLFDVELFSRYICLLGKDKALEKMEEIPVKKWIDQGDSKVKISYFFRLWLDLYRIRKEHKKNYHQQN